MKLRVLLVEPELEDSLFFRDVLTEIGEGHYWAQWVQIETLHAVSWEETSAILASEVIDVILLDLDLGDSQGIDTFRRVQNAVPQIPVIVLTDSGEDMLGLRLVREGAQDFLAKEEVDCAPLAHAIRGAVERHRLLTATRAAAMHDTLTGLANRAGFLTFAERDRKLAERLGRKLMVIVAEPRNLNELAEAHGEQRRDLALVEAADHLRSLTGPADLVARIGETRFALTIFDTQMESIEAAWDRVHSEANKPHIQMGVSIFDPDRPLPLDVLMERATLDLAPVAVAMRR